MSNSLRLHGQQHARLPCPSLSPRVCSSSCPLSRWCYITILSSATLFSFCLPSFPASGSDAHKIISVDMVFHKPKFSSVAQLCLTLCDPLDCSTPGFPVHHQLPELAQTHVHRVSDAIQPSHPLSSPSPPAFNLSQHQGLFQWVSSLHQVAKLLGASASASVLPMNIQDWFPLGWTGWISLQSKGLSRVFSNTSVQKHQFFGAPFLYCPNLCSYIPCTGSLLTASVIWEAPVKLVEWKVRFYSVSTYFLICQS